MKTKTIRVSVDLLEKLEKKLRQEGHASEVLSEHLGIYINEILWKYVNAQQESSSEWRELYEKFRQMLSALPAKPREIHIDPLSRPVVTKVPAPNSGHAEKNQKRG